MDRRRWPFFFIFYFYLIFNSSTVLVSIQILWTTPENELQFGFWSQLQLMFYGWFSFQGDVAVFFFFVLRILSLYVTQVVFFFFFFIGRGGDSIKRGIYCCLCVKRAWITNKRRRLPFYFIFFIFFLSFFTFSLFFSVDHRFFFFFGRGETELQPKMGHEIYLKKKKSIRSAIVGVCVCVCVFFSPFIESFVLLIRKQKIKERKYSE